MTQISIETASSNVLSTEIQNDLIRKWKTNGDIEARNTVLLANQKMVFKIAHKRFYNGPVAFDEMVQNLFLKMHSIIDRFDPDMGVPFSVFLWKNLDGYSLHHLNQKWNSNVSLDAGVANDDESSVSHLDMTSDTLPSAEENVINEDIRNAMKMAIDKLDEIEKVVITKRFGLDNDEGTKVTLETLAEELGYTKAGILAVEVRALGKLREMINQ